MKIHPILATMLVGLLATNLSGADSIGLNFSVTADPSTELQPDEKAGVDKVDQSHWNNLSGTTGTLKKITDNTGRTVLNSSAEWTVPPGDTAWRSLAGHDWGFKENNLKLQKGYIQLGASLEVTGVPYTNYDVYVYFNAGENGGAGKVTISAPAGKVDPIGTLFLKIDWQNGAFLRSEAATLEGVQSGNYVIFKGNSARKFKLEWDGRLQGGWIGVSAVQIIKAQ